MVAISPLATFGREIPARTLPKGPRWPLAEMRTLAVELSNLLADSVTRIGAGGSIRRQCPDAGDIELIARPTIGTLVNLLGEPCGTSNLLDLRVLDLLQRGVLELRLDSRDQRHWGEASKRLIFKDRPVDLFSVVAPAQWGVIHVLRTGPGAFNKRLVTHRRHHGWCPDTITWRDGQLWPWDFARPLDTPEEVDVFEALHLPYLAPEHRTDTVRPVHLAPKDRPNRPHDPSATVWYDPATKEQYHDEAPANRTQSSPQPDRTSN